MTDDEVTAFIRDSRKLQLATINPDGTPHLVTMFYGLVDGNIAFWTYGKAQKTLNLARDPRVTCLIEAGDDYFELRGVMVYGAVRRIDDQKSVLDVGMAVTRRMTSAGSGADPRADPGTDPGTDPGADDQLREYVAHTGRKRVAFVVEPTRVVSWDHRKLGAPANGHAL
jgi:hypothetical protein